MQSSLDWASSWFSENALCPDAGVEALAVRRKQAFEEVDREVSWTGGSERVDDAKRTEMVGTSMSLR